MMLFSSLSWPEIPAHVTPTKVKLGDLIRLTLRLTDASSIKMPDLTSLQPDFQIVGSENRAHYTYQNGQSEKILEWTILLVANKSGKLTIPALKLGQDYTKALTIDVLDPGQEPAPNGSTTSDSPRKTTANSKELFIKTTVNETNPFVHQEVNYKVQIYIKHSLMDAVYIPPQVDNALIITLSKEKQYQTIINGETYLVSEQNYAIFPEKSGELMIQPPQLSALIYSNFPEKVEASGESIKLLIKPEPLKSTHTDWLPAKKVHLSEAYEPSTTKINQGDTFTRIITLKALGIPAQLLPNISLKSNDNFTVYPEKMGENNQIIQDDILGEIKIKASYLMNKAGDITLPEIRVSWFNINKGKEETTILPARKMQISGSIDANEKPISPHSMPSMTLINQQKLTQKRPNQALDGPNKPWLPWLLASFFALIWVFTLILAFLKLKEKRNLTQKQILKSLKNACLSNQARLAKELIMTWAIHYWSTPKIKDLEDIMALSQDKVLNQALEALAEHLYQSNVGSWQGKPLWEAVNSYGYKKKKNNTIKITSLPKLNRFNC